MLWAILSSGIRAAYVCVHHLMVGVADEAQPGSSALCVRSGGAGASSVHFRTGNPARGKATPGRRHRLVDQTFEALRQSGIRASVGNGRQATRLPGVKILKPRFFHDSRGYFVETYNKRSAQELGMMACFVQDNQSLSIKPGTVRALHFQVPPRPQAKLVRVLRGSIYDVALDLRVGSPTYGSWTRKTLTAKGGEQMFVPHGFAHGFCTLEPNTEVAYKVDDYYAPECERGLLGMILHLPSRGRSCLRDAILSEKDRKLGCLRTLFLLSAMMVADV